MVEGLVVEASPVFDFENRKPDLTPRNPRTVRQVSAIS